MIETTRLKLIPATVALARAEIGDRGEFARLLGASVPDNWPPETAADALPLFLRWFEAAPDRVGWFGWYALVAGNEAALPVLVGGGGVRTRVQAFATKGHCAVDFIPPHSTNE